MNQGENEAKMMMELTDVPNSPSPTMDIEENRNHVAQHLSFSKENSPRDLRTFPDSQRSYSGIHRNGNSSSESEYQTPHASKRKIHRYEVSCVSSEEEKDHSSRNRHLSHKRLDRHYASEIKPKCKILLADIKSF